MDRKLQPIDGATPPEERRKIALFVPSFRGGGAERAMILFAEGLLATGYSVDFLVAQNTGPLRDSLPSGARLIDLAARKVSFAIPSLVRYLRAERPAALYSTIVNANLTAIAARWLSRVRCPVIVRESNVLSPEAKMSGARRLSGALAPLAYRFAHSVISVSEDVKAELSEAAPKLAARIRVLPNPVVSDRMLALAEVPPAHPWLQQDANIPVILGAGRLHPQKDFPTLIRAFAELRRKREGRLIILGEGDERPKLEALVHWLEIAEFVSLPGYIENPFPYLKRANVFVLSSRYEGMPNVLLQAMAFGTPVIATDGLSGAKEVLKSGTFGRLFPAGDVSKLASALEESLPGIRNSAAATFVAENFSVSRATKEYLNVAGLSS